MIGARICASEDGKSMLYRRVKIIAVALGGALLAACQPKVLTPTEFESVQTASDAYLAYEQGDCTTVRELTDPAQLEVWAFNEMRHSMLLLGGFCREIDGDTKGARDIYRQLVLEAPNSFASEDAVERTRILKIMAQDPDYARQILSAPERLDLDKPKREPIDRVSAEFPPLARATRIDGYAIVEFRITRRGDTENPIVVESSPPLLFDGTAIRAVRRWHYMPKTSSSNDDQQVIRILFKGDAPPDSQDEEETDLSAPQ
jgi:TonB family protein